MTDPQLSFFALMLGVILVGLPLGLWVRWLSRELRAAQDRLLAAWDAGKVIPPRPETEPPKPVALPPLPPELQAFVDQWESDASKVAEESRIRRWRADGWSDTRIARQLGGASGTPD